MRTQPYRGEKRSHDYWATIAYYPAQKVGDKKIAEENRGKNFYCCENGILEICELSGFLDMWFEENVHCAMGALCGCSATTYYDAKTGYRLGGVKIQS